MCFFALTLIKFVILFTDILLRRLVNRRKREIILIFLKKKRNEGRRALAGENAGTSVVGGTFGGTKSEIGNFEGICWVSYTC